MDRGIYAATSGGLRNVRQIDVVANNLANVNTVGFKAQRLVSREQNFSDTMANILENMPASASANFPQVPGVVDVGTKTDFTPGPIQYTGNPLDVALRKENQFFVVSTPEGEQLTRAGNFSLDVEGRLITPDGNPVLGDGGELSLPVGPTSINSGGNIFVGGAAVGRLRVVEVQNLAELERTEGVRFKPSPGAALTTVDAEIENGAVEMPNVGVVEAMVEMISAQRGFEAYTKTIRTIDELNERAIRGARQG